MHWNCVFQLIYKRFSKTSVKMRAFLVTVPGLSPSSSFLLMGPRQQWWGLLQLGCYPYGGPRLNFWLSVFGEGASRWKFFLSGHCQITKPNFKNETFWCKLFFCRILLLQEIKETLLKEISEWGTLCITTSQVLLSKFKKSWNKMLRIDL